MLEHFSRISDFEINLRIIYKLFPGKYQFSNYPKNSDVCCWEGDGSSGQEIYNFCEDNNWSMKLMIDNNIDLSFNSLMNAWVASKGVDSIDLSFSKNPRRAVAECFLKLHLPQNNQSS